MPQRSAGLLIYRLKGAEPEVFLVHPGGPFWARKDEGAWSMKGLVEDGEDELAAARREVTEEVGATVEGDFQWLGEYRQPGGKRVLAWTVEADIDIDPETIASNMFTMEWPPRSGAMRDFPEVDRAGWFSLRQAEDKMLKGQRQMLAGLAAQLQKER
jgi:predicted NUDIX family NTP pyrophosphohydrolase